MCITHVVFRRCLLCIAGCLILATSAPAAPINSDLVIKLDAAAANVTLPGPTGNAGFPRVSQWNDTAALGGANNATQATTQRMPEYRASVPAMNNQPALHFEGNPTLGGSIDADGQTDLMEIFGVGANFNSTRASTLFIAGRLDPQVAGSVEYTLYDTGTVDTHWQYSGGSGYFGVFRSARVEGSLPTGGAAQSGSQVFELVAQGGLSAPNALTDYRYFESGTAKGTDTSANFISGTDHRIGNSIVAEQNQKAFEGYVSEVLVYNSALNDAARAIVTNYMSAKYDIPITNNRYSGDNPGIDYDSDVFGIGQSSAGNSVLSSENNAGLQITGNGTLSDGDWVLAGHKTAVNSINGDGIWTRVWYVDKTTTDGVDATLTFDYSDAGLVMPGISGQALISLLYSPTDPFNFSSLGIAATVNGDQISFLVPNAQLLDGFYTLQAIGVPEPSTLALLALGAVGWAIRTRRRRTVA